MKETAQCLVNEVLANVVTGSPGLGPQMTEAARKAILVKKEDWEDGRSKEWSQSSDRTDDTIRIIWVNPPSQDPMQVPRRGLGGPEAQAHRWNPRQRARHLPPTADDVVLLDIVKGMVSEVLHKVLTGGRGPSQQPGLKAGRALLQVPEDKPVALVKKEDWEDERSQEWSQSSQGTDDTIHTIWVNPLFQEHFQDSHAGPQEGSGWPSTMKTEVWHQGKSCVMPKPECPTTAAEPGNSAPAALSLSVRLKQKMQLRSQIRNAGKARASQRTFLKGKRILPLE